MLCARGSVSVSVGISNGLMNVLQTDDTKSDGDMIQRDGLVNIEELMEIIWPSPRSRPTLRWCREMQARRVIPYIKIGGLVFFDPKEVRRALARRNTVQAA